MDRKRKETEEINLVSKRPKSEDKNSFQYLKNVFNTTVTWKGQVEAKINAAAPYNFFLTRIQDIKDTYDEDLSITFWELLDPSLGDLEHTILINFMVNAGWLLAQFAVGGRPNPSATVLYQHTDPDGDISDLPPHIKLKAHKIDMGDPFGHHHSKMMIFFYKDGSARVVVTTANFTESDWENRTQGVWISPKLSPLPTNSDKDAGESITHFKQDLIDYLSDYKVNDLVGWIERLRNVDMSSIMVCLIASIPGSHVDNKYGYRKLKDVLNEHCTSSKSHAWSLIAQCSSIGSLGPTPSAWVCGQFGRALDEKSSKDVSVMVIYPSLSNVKGSVDGMLGGACLPYNSKTHQKQKWLNQHLWQWKSNGRNRTRAVPHIKTYTKLSPSGKEAAWFLMTSANLSQAAWGTPTPVGLRVRSYEVGVLFLPKFMTGESEFRVKTTGSFDKSEDFPFPYDTPLTPYSSSDQIFLYDKCFN